MVREINRVRSLFSCVEPVTSQNVPTNMSIPKCPHSTSLLEHTPIRNMVYSVLDPGFLHVVRKSDRAKQLNIGTILLICKSLYLRVIACILVILFLFFFIISNCLIGNNLIKRNY
jgi:hypothetical protein